MARRARGRKPTGLQAPKTQTADGRVIKRVDSWIEENTTLVIREADTLEQIESALLEARFAGSPEDVAISYLYLIPPRTTDRQGKPVPKEFQRPGIVGPNSDFVNQMVRMLNSTQRTRMTIADDEPPLFQEATTADGKPAIRCIVKAIDKSTGDVRWAVKVEAKSAHADTIALVKAQKKALESLPGYDRRTVARRIVQFLRSQEAALLAHGIEPRALVVSGMGAVSQWSDLFARAKEAGVKPDAVRDAVRKETGKGLSEVKTAADVGRAATAAEKVIVQGPLFDNTPASQEPAPAAPKRPTPAAPVPAATAAPTEPEDLAERERVLHGIADALAGLDISPPAISNSLKMQFGQGNMDKLTLPQLRQFHQQLLRRLQNQKTAPGGRTA